MPITVSQVVASCLTLPEPGWHRVVDHPDPRHAATLIPVVDVGGEAGVVLTRRSRGMDHGGDWVFPGGRVEEFDATHGDAARRETAEELGLDISDVEVLGQLSTRGPIITGFLIETYVGVIRSDAVLDPDTREVAAVAVVPLSAFLAHDRHHRGPATGTRRIDPEVIERFGFTPEMSDLRHYRVEHDDGTTVLASDDHLWGMQADILHEFLHHLTDGRHDF